MGNKPHDPSEPFLMTDGEEETIVDGPDTERQAGAGAVANRRGTPLAANKPRDPSKPFLMTDGEEETVVDGLSVAPGTGMMFQPGDLVDGQFEVMRPIGRGGMGVVYEVTDRLTQQHLALKLIRASILSNPKAVDRFIREAMTCRRLRHNGIVAVYDVRRSASLLFFTMEYVPGKSLRALLKEKPRLSLLEVAAILHPLCTALEYAHAYTVHRDISPENVMVCDDGAVKLLDFGLAKALDPAAALTRTRTSMGKAYYMAPEQRRDAAHVDARADIYPLGVMFFEMLTGELPVGYSKLTELRPELPGECDRLLRQTLVRAERRFREVGAFREALEAGVRAANVKGSLRHAPPRAKQGGAQVKNEAFWSKAVGLFEKESYDTVLRGGARGPSGEGALISVYDIRSARNLLEEGAAAAVRVPKSSRREQNPLQLTNGGTGRLQVFAQCQGAGVDVSPGHVVIPPGTMASIIVRVDPVSDPSARLLLWRSEHGTNEAFEIIIHRS